MKKFYRNINRHSKFVRRSHLPLIVFATLMSLAVLPSFGTTNLSWSVEYDRQDRVSARIDPAGRATRYTYTPLTNGPLESVTRTPPEGGPVTWRFDARGRLAAMTDGAGEAAYRYDQHGRLVAVARKGAPEIQYAYDAGGRLADLRVGDFYHMAWTYDFFGRIEKMDTPAGPVSYEYRTSQETVVRSLTNGIKTLWKRPPNGQLNKITHRFFVKPDGEEYTKLAEYTYQYGPEGRIAGIREFSGQGEVSKRYAYDTMGRLFRASDSAGREYGYAYDLVGNRIKATTTGHADQICAYDWAGRLTSVDGKPCQYDACGNLTGVTLGGIAREYRYAPDGRLAAARVGTDTVEYQYDGFGSLIARKTAAGEARFIPDPVAAFWRPLVIEDRDGKRTLVIWEGDTPLALLRDGQVEWLLQDHLGSVRMVVDGAGKVKQRRQYDTFGLPAETDQDAALSPGFAGLFLDRQAGGYLTLARSFCPDTGSFLQPDPKKRVPSPTTEDISLYAYCGADPVNFRDRNGAAADSFDAGQIWWNNYLQGVLYYSLDTQYAKNTYATLAKQQNNYIWDVPGMLIGGPGGDSLQGWGGIPVNVAEAIFLTPAAAVSAGVGLGADLGHGKWGMAAMDSVLLGFGFGAGKFTDQLERQSEQVWNWTHPDKSGQLVYDWTKKEVSDLGHAIDNLIPWIKHSPDALGVASDLSRVTANAGKESDPGSSSAINAQHLAPANNLPKPDFHVNFWKPDDHVFPLFADIWRGGPPRWLGGGGEDDPPFGPGGGGVGGGSYRPPPPSPVGGVYLGGAGGALNGLGTLKGIRTDANGNFVLIGEDGGDIKLPPLRIDDLVTVFRSVYLYGEGPTVTINPNTNDPTKSPMIIEHSDATKDTYVGWILYQADRLMKTYTLGVDNFTSNNIVTRVSSYREVLDAIFSGAEDLGASQKRDIWERFWIVPAAASSFEGLRKELTLFDVPLKVKTQKMKWELNKLVDDLTGKSSSGAMSFTNWFTKNYDSISAEQYLLPPPESGITSPVPVFSELRRVALMTAIAEQLRRQKVPMPFWMWDYEVKPVPFETTTPALRVERLNRGIFGGVALSPETKAVKTYASPADVERAPLEVRAGVDRNFHLADHLEKVVAEAFPRVDSTPLTVRPFADGNQGYQAVSLPGTETRALGPCRLVEPDLTIPVMGGQDLRLVRSFNSFFNPKGPWGRGWAFDLPQLKETRFATSREGDSVISEARYELITPLNSLHASFSEVRPVPELRNSQLQVPDQDGPFYGLANGRPAFLDNTDTHLLILKNGQRWRFTSRGDLAAIEDGPQVTVYERGNSGQITRIYVTRGRARVAQIVLAYNGNGTLSKAVGTTSMISKTQPVVVNYAYDPAGRLTEVSFAEGTAGYRYQGHWVAAITWTDKTRGAQAEERRTFDYNPQGQLTAEKRGKSTLQYVIKNAPGGGTEESVTEAGDDSHKASNRYDERMRPVEANDADRTRTTWTYQQDGGIQTTVTTPDNRKVTVIDPAGGRERTVKADGQPEVTAHFDAGGHMTDLAEDGQKIMEETWLTDGRMTKVVAGSRTSSLHYSENGLLASVLKHPSGETETLHHWQETTVDQRGLPTRLKDSSGLDVTLGYDADGKLASAIQKTSEGSEGYNIKRDAAGRVKAIESSWGTTTYGYAKDGAFQRVESLRGGESTAVDLSGGRIRKITAFDKGVTSFDYADKGGVAGPLLGVTCANGLKLANDYDPGQRLTGVTVGADHRVRLGYDAKNRVVSYALEPLTP